jgi:hypothetical protein
MAVIKIVPMPGAKGDKGDEGAIGPQGLQGATGLQGPAGADAAWYYNGEYNPGAGYSVGDVVTYEGQTWYRKNANGGNVGDTPSEGLFWDLIAAKAENAVTSTSGTWDTKFKELNGIVDSNPNPYGVYPTTGKYYTVGDLVFYEFNLLVFSPETWGNSTSWQIELPFKVSQLNDGDISGLTRQVGQGSIFMRADEPPFFETDPNTGQVVQDWEDGEIVSLPVYLRSRWLASETTSIAYLSVNLPRTGNWPTSTAINAFWGIGNNWPVNFTEGLVDENPTLPTYFRFTVNGTYRRA